MHEGIVLAVIGSLVYSFKSWFDKLFEYLCTLVLVSIQSQEPHVLKAVTEFKSWTNLNYGWGYGPPVLAPGTHVLWRPVPIVIHIKKTETSTDISFTTLWIFNSDLRKLYDQLRVPPRDHFQFAFIRESVFTSSYRKVRDPASLVLPRGLWDDIVSDVRHFTERRITLQKKGLQMKRSFLLYGPPGTGKTSLVQVLAGYFNYDLYICKAPKFKNMYQAISRAIETDLAKAILLFDDIDELIKAEDFDLGQFISMLDNLPMSGLIIFTCNDPSSLPSKLTRVGRIDRKIKVDYVDRDQVQRMFAYFYPEASQAAAAKFASNCNAQIPSAVIQEFLLRHSYKEAIRTIESYLKQLEAESKELAKNYN